MTKKNKTDFIDEEEFLSAVSMNKKGGCVKMGKPPQEAEDTSHAPEQRETTEAHEHEAQGIPAVPQKSKDTAQPRKASRQGAQDSPLAKIKAGRENVQRKATYISVKNHKRCSIAAEVYHIPRGQIVDYVLDGWWEQCRDEIKALYYRDKDVFEEE